MPSNKKTACQGVDGACDNEGKRRRQNTAYNDEEQNWVVMCDECAAHNDEHWDDMWRELNQNLYDSTRN